MDQAAETLKAVGYGVPGSLAFLAETQGQAIDDRVVEENYDYIRSKAAELPTLQARLSLIQRGEGSESWGTEEQIQKQIALAQSMQDLLDAYGQMDQNSLGSQLMAKSQEHAAAALEGTSGLDRILTQTALSMGQNLPGIAANFIPVVGPALGLGLMGAQAAGSRAYELTQQGVSPWEALSRGLVSGGIEILTEKIPLDNLTKMIRGTSGKSFVKNLLSQMGIEATEESASYTANYLADKIAKDPNAEWSTRELLENAAAGALSGGFFATGGQAIGSALNRQTVTGAASPGQRQTQADPEAQAREQALEMLTGNVPGPETVQQTERTPQEAAETPVQALREAAATIPATARNTQQAQSGKAQAPSPAAKGSSAAKTVKLHRVSGQAQTASTRQTVSPQVRGALRQAQTAMLTQMSRTLGTSGEKSMMAAWDNSGDPGQYSAGFVRVYNQALAGTPTGKIQVPASLNDAQVMAAYSAGQNDRKMNLEQAKTAAQQAEVAGKNTALYAAEDGTEAGLVYDSYVKESMDPDTAVSLSTIARQLGLRVQMVDSVAGGKAYAEIQGSDVLIEKNSDNPVRSLFGHELTHRVQQLAPESYRAFRDYVMQSDQAQADVQQKIADYKKAGVKLTQEQAMDEITANYAGEMIEDQDLLKQFIQKNKANQSLLRRFLEAVKDMARKLTGSYKKQAKDAAALLEKAVGDAARQAGKLQTNKNTAGKGGVRYSAKDNPYAGKSLSEDSSVYDYDFLAKLPDMVVLEMPSLNEVKSGDKVSRQKAIDLGLNNAAELGRKVTGTISAVRNRYTGREIRISQNGLGHSLSGKNAGRLRTNARLTAIGGSIIQNAVPINALKSTNPQARGTYAMACLLKSADLDVVAIVTVEQHTNRVKDLSCVDIAHSINGRLNTKKEGSKSSTRDPVSNTDTATSNVKITDFLEIVNATHQSILSDNVLAHFKEERNQDGHYTGRVKFSLKGSDDYQGLVEKYGAIEQGENPRARDVQVPRQTADGKKVSRTVRTVMEAAATPDAMVPTIQEMVEKGEFSYEVASDKAAIENAEATIREKGFQAALMDWTSALASGKVNKQNTATGWALYNAAAQAGDAKTAADIMSKIVYHQRDAAQAVQATRILKKMSPGAQLYGIQRSVQNMQEELQSKYGDKAPNLKIPDELVENYLNAESQQERDEAEKQIYLSIGKQMPSTFQDKWNAWRYLAMLFNVRTHIRNVVGNAGFAVPVLTKNAVGTALEGVGSVVSGGKMQRTKGIYGADLFTAAWKDYQNAKPQIMAGGKYDDSVAKRDAIEEGRRIFKNRFLESLRRFNSGALELEDGWFAKPHYANALAQYCAANKITAQQLETGEGLDQAALDAARAYAIKEAQKATYRDFNDFSDFISSMGRYSGDNKVKKVFSAAVEGVLPFRKTPANILVRAVEYSPIGLIDGIWELTYGVKTGKNTAAEALDRLSAGLTGTGLFALGVYLASQGLLSASGDDDDKQKAYDDLLGKQEYAIQLPDGTNFTIDWLAPECIPVFMGAEYFKAMDDRENGEAFSLTMFLDSMSKVTNPMLEMSCLSSLNDLFDNLSGYKTGDVSSLVVVVANMAVSYLTQGVPTLMGQGERSSQEDRMTTYTDKNKDLPTDWQYTLGKVSGKTPGWDYGQIPYIDAWGQKETESSTGKRIVNNFVNPAYISRFQRDKVEAELQRLYTETGESVLPERAERYFNLDKERVDLTGEQYVTYATEMGQRSYALVASFVNAAYYGNKTDGDRAAAIDMLYTYAAEQAKKAVFPEYVSSQSWVTKAEAASEEGVKPEDYIYLYSKTRGVEGLPDGAGDTIKNSKSLQIMEAVNDSGVTLTDKQKALLFDDFGVGKTVIGYNPAKVKQELSKMR